MSKLPRGPDYVDMPAFPEGCKMSVSTVLQELVLGIGLPSLIVDITVSVVRPEGRWKSMFSLLIVFGLKYLQQQIICHVLYYALYMLISFCICLQTVVTVHLPARFILFCR
jgi:hypothetical protein